MLNPLGKVIIDLRDDAAFASWTERVRGEEPGPGDAKAAPDYERFAVVSYLGGLREAHAPVHYPRFSIALYGTSPRDAMEGYCLASDALHALGPRLHSNGLGFYQSLDDTGGTPDRDPGTGQPVVRFVVQMVATTLAVA